VKETAWRSAPTKRHFWQRAARPTPHPAAVPGGGGLDEGQAQARAVSRLGARTVEALEGAEGQGGLLDRQAGSLVGDRRST
jgi:hypothetical protein